METLRKWVRTAERREIPEQQALDAEREGVKTLERENREQANEVLHNPAFFGQAELDRSRKYWSMNATSTGFFRD